MRGKQLKLMRLKGEGGRKQPTRLIDDRAAEGNEALAKQGLVQCDRLQKRSEGRHHSARQVLHKADCALPKGQLRTRARCETVGEVRISGLGLEHEGRLRCVQVHTSCVKCLCVCVKCE